MRPGHLVVVAVLIGRTVGRAMRHPLRALAAAGGLLTAMAVVTFLQLARRGRRG